MFILFLYFFFFFFNDTATTEIYTLSLHDALPISPKVLAQLSLAACAALRLRASFVGGHSQFLSQGAPARRRDLRFSARSEEHTSELQSQSNLVCRLLLEKKKKNTTLLLRASYHAS